MKKILAKAQREGWTYLEQGIVAKIRNLSFEDQTNLTGVAREIFLLICEEE